jgi:hypothetical protein
MKEYSGGNMSFPETVREGSCGLRAVFVPRVFAAASSRSVSVWLGPRSFGHVADLPSTCALFTIWVGLT